MIPNAILVLNGKGGVLKTSVAANLGGGAAAGGWKVLAVDLDRQGNLARDLGYLADSDDGRSLADAVANGTAPTVLSDVRPGLDVIAGGPHLDGLVADMQRGLLGGDLTVPDRLGATIGPLAAGYDVVVFDSPPGEALLHSAAIRAAHYILIPTQPDAASIDGLGQVATIVARERTANPDLEVLGVCFGPLPARAAAIERNTRATLSELLGDDVPVFNTVIRDAKKVAVDCRERGELAHEYENAAAAAEPWWKLRRRRADGEAPAEEPPRFSSAASNLAGDYQQLTLEVFARFSERQAVWLERQAPAGERAGG